MLTEFNKIREDNPILFLDYDGTLVPIIPDPEKSFPDDELIRLLDSLNSKYDMYIVTGRSLKEIRAFLGERYNVIALHGAVISRRGGEVETVEGYSEFRKTCNDLYDRREEFARRFPGARIFNKDGGIVFTKWYVDRSLYDKLDSEVCEIAKAMGMSCYRGKMIVEIRIPGVNKGETIKQVRNGRPALIAGDDYTDEDAFRVNGDAISIKVGDGTSKARFNVKDYSEFRRLLASL